MARRVTRKDIITTSDIVTTSASDPFLVGGATSVSIQAVVDVNTPAATTFADGDVTVVGDLITKAAHGLTTTGLKVQLTSSGTLPAGLSLATDYYVIVVSSSTYKLASSLANAQAGTAVDITAAAGGGTHTVTPVAIAGASVTLQKSNSYGKSGVTAQWDAVESATAITADGNIWISDVDPEYEYARVSYTLTAGKLSAATHVLVKEDE